MRSSTHPQWVTLAGLMITHILDIVAHKYLAKHWLGIKDNA